MKFFEELLRRRRRFPLPDERVAIADRTLTDPPPLPDLGRVHEAFSAVLGRRSTALEARLVREATDGTLLRQLESASSSDPRLVALLREVSAIPSRNGAAWTLWHLLQREVQPPVAPAEPALAARSGLPWRAALLVSALAVMIPAGTGVAHLLGWTRAASRAETRTFGIDTSLNTMEDALMQQIRTRRRIESLLADQPDDASAVWKVLDDSGDGLLVASMLRVIDSSRDIVGAGTVFEWSRTEAWDSTMSALRADLPVILQAAREMELSPRLVALPALCEQLRRAESFRDRYKRMFGQFIPTGTQSMGVTGVKPETVRRLSKWCEPRFRHLVDSIPDEEIARRLQSGNHLWAYRYAALCLRSIRAQWAEAGVDLSQRPEILMTIYNLGMNKCPPRPNPQAGGAIFTLDDVEYTFGSFSWEFYWSGRAYPELPF